MEPLNLQEFPRESCTTVKEWVDEIATELWAQYDVADCLELHLADDSPEPNLPSLDTPGWHKLIDWYWQPIEPWQLPLFLTIDVETEQGEDGLYYPVLATAYGVGGWYAWRRDDSNPTLTIPMEPGRISEDDPNPTPFRILVGHNICTHDAKYFSSEYAEHPPQNIYIDTMALATITRGLNGSTMETLYKTSESLRASGHAAPKWYEHAWRVSLQELAKRILGVNLTKSIQAKDLLKVNGENAQDKLQGEHLTGYCALDVWITHRLFQHLYPIVAKQYLTSPVSWVGMTEMAKCQVFLKDWDDFLAQSDADHRQATTELAHLIQDLAEEAQPAEFPHWNWEIVARGKYKGWPKWRQALDKDGYSATSRTGIELLRLHWKGEPIEWEDISLRVGHWITKTTRQPLPHPDGDKPLTNPLCGDYTGFARSGQLTSGVLEAEGLQEVFATLRRTDQYTRFRKRYAALYRIPKGPGLDIVRPDINPCGTITRRATSSLWGVSPNEDEDVIGSGMLKHVVAPPGYRVVYADFDAQEPWLMALLTDAEAGNVGSSEWTQAVLNGRKEDGTDIHSLIASRQGFSRDVAKTLNCAAGYGAGVTTLASALWTTVGNDYDEAEAQATAFLERLKGKGGIAETTFATLSKHANTPNNRTAILGCKMPDSINPEYCGKEFYTTRQNWAIQSAGVDCLHTLIVLTKAFFMELEVDGYLMLHRHDSGYWAVREGQEEQAKHAIQSAHYWTVQLAYEQASRHAQELRAREGFAGTAAILAPPPNRLWFSSVEVGDHAGSF